jgi:hypothetical protein
MRLLLRQKFFADAAQLPLNALDLVPDRLALPVVHCRGRGAA